LHAPSLRRVRNILALGRLLPAYVLFAFLKHVIPLRRLARWAWCPPAGPRDREAERRLVADVLRLSNLIGLSDRDCLQRSLLLYRLLSRAGADPNLSIGFRQMNGRLLGHAWVVVDNRAIIESELNLCHFSAVLSFNSAGGIVEDPSRSADTSLSEKFDARR
jgi:hypothetical protein